MVLCMNGTCELTLFHTPLSDPSKSLTLSLQQS